MADSNYLNFGDITGDSRLIFELEIRSIKLSSFSKSNKILENISSTPVTLIELPCETKLFVQMVQLVP